jgi:hypothetical protein
MMPQPIQVLSAALHAQWLHAFVFILPVLFTSII